MGLLDDLAMGFGLKERTEDYDARTARTIALNERFGTGPDADMLGRSRALANRDYDVTRGGAAQYLGSRGYEEGYTPQIVQDDDRSFMQRLLYSPESDPSPTPYAIGPLRMDQPIQVPKFGILGLLSGLGGMFGRDVPTVSADASPMRVRPVSGYNLGGSAQTGTRFDTSTEAEPIDYSDGIPVQDPVTIAATEALANLSDMPPALSFLKDPSDTMPEINNLDPFRPKESGVDEFGRRLPLNLPSDPTYYSGVDFTFPELSVPVNPVSNTPVSAPSLSDADQMMALRSAIMRQPNMVGEFEQAFGADMVREALSSLRSMGGSLIPPKSPLSRRDMRRMPAIPRITRFD